MRGTRSPVPRLDKLSVSVHSEAAHAAVPEPDGQLLSPAHMSSTSVASHPAGAVHPGTTDLRRSSRNDRRSPPRSPQARHHGKTFGVPALTPLSAILFGNANGAAKKPNSQTGRLKAVLRERAVSRGMRRPDVGVDLGASSSPEPHEAASLGDRAATEAVSAAAETGLPANGTDSPPALSPEPSSAAVPCPPSVHQGLPMVTEEDIQRAFRFFAGGKDEENFTEENLLERCSYFYPGLSGKDARLLMGHGAMTADKLRKVVHIARHRDLAAFDPIAEAFKILDPREAGHADMDVLADLLAHVPGVHRLTDEDRRFLLKISDIDGDGLISEADFRRCSTFLPPTAQDQAAAREAARAY